MKNEFSRIANRVSLLSIFINIILSVLKLLAGIFAHSSAMISDAVHSASDVFSTFIVIIGIKIASKEPDREHPYGHERMECAAAIVLSALLLITGCAIGLSAAKTVIAGDHDSIQKPGALALAAALISIAVKEAMYWYTRHYAKKIDSSALMADAQHHRSDALSSVGALIGIGFAIMGYPIADPIASLVIFIFIVKASVDIFREAMAKMVDRSCDDNTEARIRECAMSTDGVLGIDMLQTRIFGNMIYVDIEIRADGALKLSEAHDIAEVLHDRIENEFPKVKHIMVHVNPEEDAGDPEEDIKA